MSTPPPDRRQPMLSERLPALNVIGGLSGIVVAALGLVGAGDIVSLTRGEPTLTTIGAILALVAVVLMGVSLVGRFAKAAPWLTLGIYAALGVALGFYLWAAVRVTSDPAAPAIDIATVEGTEESRVTVKADTLSYNERLHVRAVLGNDKEVFASVVLGGGRDGKVAHSFAVPPPIEEQRLRVTAQVLRAEDIPAELECNKQEAGRLCSQLARVLVRPLPRLDASIRNGGLRVVVTDTRAIPGVLALRVMRRDREIYATRTRVDGDEFTTTVRLAAPPKRQASSRKKAGRDVVCVAAAYGSALPICDDEGDAVALVRIAPRAADVRAAGRPRVAE